MNTYWDHTRKERAAMSREDVELFLDAELMMKGVLKVSPPVLDDVPVVASPITKTFFQVETKKALYYALRDLSAFAFSTAEDAQAFLAMHPSMVQDGAHGTKYAQPAEDMRLKPVEVCTHQEYLNSKTALEAAEAIKNQNDVAERAFNEAAKKMKEVLTGVWNDWGECRETDRRHKQVHDTLAEYTKTAGDNLAMAIEFLRKAFSDGVIRAAFEWIEEEVPAVLAKKEADAA